MNPQDEVKKVESLTLADIYHKAVDFSETELTKLKEFAEKLLNRVKGSSVAVAK